MLNISAVFLRQCLYCVLKNAHAVLYLQSNLFSMNFDGDMSISTLEDILIAGNKYLVSLANRRSLSLICTSTINKILNKRHKIEKCNSWLWAYDKRAIHLFYGGILNWCRAIQIEITLLHKWISLIYFSFSLFSENTKQINLQPHDEISHLQQKKLRNKYSIYYIIIAQTILYQLLQ